MVCILPNELKPKKSYLEAICSLPSESAGVTSETISSDESNGKLMESGTSGGVEGDSPQFLPPILLIAKISGFLDKGIVIQESFR